MLARIISGILIYVMAVTQVVAQTATLLPNAEQTFLGTTGAPLAAGTVTLYTPNSTNKKTTWVDPNQVSANTNPINLDAAGRAIIFGQGNYRQVVKDVNGVTIWDAFTSAVGSASPSGSTGTDTAPVGTVLPYSGFAIPTNWQLAYGQPLNRVTFASLLTAITISNTAVSCTATSTTLTGFASTAQFSAGEPIEATCLPSNTTIASITNSTTIVVSAAAVSSGALTAVVFPWGNGDGNSTFNVPDLRGRTFAGADAMGGTAANLLTASYYGASAAAPGISGGSQSLTLVAANLPPYTPTGSVSTPTITLTNNHGVPTTDIGGSVPYGGGSNAGVGNITATASTPTFTGVAQGGTSTPLSNIQPTLTVNYIIKVAPNSSGAGGVVSIGGMFGDIICDATFLCTNQTIGLATQLTGTILANIGASTMTPTAVSFTQLMDNICGSTSGQIPYRGVSSWGCVFGQPLSRTNDTNVTLTLGGSPTTSLLASTSMTLGWSGTLAVSRGGSGVGIFTPNLPLIGNGTGAISQGTLSGNTTSFGTTSGTLTNGHCISIDSSGNLVDAGGVCTTGGGGGTVSAAIAGQIAYYVSSGTAVSGTNALPNGTTATTQTSSDNTTKVATDAFVQSIVNPLAKGSDGAIQGSNGSGGFVDSTFASVTPVNGASITGKIFQVANIGCAGCSGSSFALLSPQSIAGFAPGGHDVYIGDFASAGGLGTGAGSVAVGSELAVVAANHCTLFGNAANCSGESSIVIGHGASAPSSSDSATVIGVSAASNAAGEIIIGPLAVSTDTGGYGIAIGYQAAISATDSIAIGRQAVTGSYNYAVAIGYGATTTGIGHVVVGGPYNTNFYGCSDTAPCPGNFGGVLLTFTRQTGGYTLLATDSTVVFATSGGATIALGNAVNFPGRIIRIKTETAEFVNSTLSNVVPLIGGSPGTAILAATAGKWADLQSDGTNWTITAGN